MNNICCECGEWVVLEDSTNDWHDQGIFEDSSAVYTGQCRVCDREYYLHQFDH